MERQAIEGGEFLLPDHQVYFPLADNMLWWFANAEWHGTAVLRYDPVAGAGRLTMAHSIPRKLWRVLHLHAHAGRGRSGSRSPIRSEEEAGGRSDDEVTVSDVL